MADKPELRHNIVSGEWVLIAPGRKRRPQQFAKETGDEKTPLKDCPFEDPQASDNKGPLIWYSKSGAETGSIKQDKWVLQVVKNKFPAVAKHKGNVCPIPKHAGLFKKMLGVGFHEVVIPRSHTKFLWDMTAKEAEVIISSYQDRSLYHRDEACLAYIFIFHNHGSRAGASVWHPHSQIIALPIIPPSIHRSLLGAWHYWREKRKCVHCAMNEAELSYGGRIIYRNEDFIVFIPFAPRIAFEVRIVPLRHDSHFENISRKEKIMLADALTRSLKKLKKSLRSPAYNFFIHTAPIHESSKYKYYHWHLEIYPKTSHFAGVELGTGVDVVAITPEESAAYLKKM